MAEESKSDYRPFPTERMSQKDAAEALGVDVRTLRRWEEEYRERGLFPRNRDGTYHLPALTWWAIANKIQIGGRR